MSAAAACVVCLQWPLADLTISCHQHGLGHGCDTITSCVLQSNVYACECACRLQSAAAGQIAKMVILAMWFSPRAFWNNSTILITTGQLVGNISSTKMYLVCPVMSAMSTCSGGRTDKVACNDQHYHNITRKKQTPNPSWTPQDMYNIQLRLTSSKCPYIHNRNAVSVAWCTDDHILLVQACCNAKYLGCICRYRQHQKPT